MTITTPSLDHVLERTVLIHAEQALVFRYFTDSARWATWWGAGSEIDARPGGVMSIRYPNGIEARGEVLEVKSPEHIVFTYGYASGKPIPTGSSRVMIRLESVAAGTRVHLRHEFADAWMLEHAQGWRYQLSLFSNVVADELAADVDPRIDAWFDAFAEPDDTTRANILTRIATPDVRFHDRFGNIDTLYELVSHIGALQHYRPNLRMRRTGSTRHVQGMVLADWISTAPHGAETVSGVNVFVLGPTGLIEWVTGFTSTTPAADPH